MSHDTTPVSGRNAALTRSGEAAHWHLARGERTVPVPALSKGCVEPGWPTLRIDGPDVDRMFAGGCNIAALLGEPSGGLVDVDLDCGEARRAAHILMPPTDRVSGRESATDSHRWYRTPAPPQKASTPYDDPTAPVDVRRIVELRSTGGATIVPPSVYGTEPDKGHASPERCVYLQDGDPATVDIQALHAAVAAVAAAALLGRYWPRGGRHDAALALAGGLLRAGWEVPRAEVFVRAVCAAAKDEEVEDRVRAVASTAATHTAGDNTTGWTRLAELLGANGDPIVSKVREWLDATTVNVTAVEVAAEAAVTPAMPEWPASPGDEAYYGLAGDIVRAIEPASEADPVALLLQTLVFFGNVIGRTAHFAVEADPHHANEYLVLVGVTGRARKGTSFGHVKQLFRTVDAGWFGDRIQTGLSSSEGLIWAVRDPIEKRERVKDRGQPVRYETVVGDEGVADKRLLIHEPEFASVLKQAERTGNTLSPVLRQALESGQLSSMTKNSPAKATGAHISMICHITDDELRRYLTVTESANGFANRNLWAAVRRSKELPEGGRPDAARMAGLEARLARTVAHGRTHGLVTRDAAARDLWRGVYGPLSTGRPGLAGALLGRAEPHVMRLAMIYALMDLSVQIRLEHLAAALAVWDYLERSVLYIFGHCFGDRVVDDLLRYLRAQRGGLTRTEMSALLGRNVGVDRIERALDLLRRFGLARPERGATGGRPVERWFAAAT